MHLKKSTGILERNSQEIRFGFFGPKTRNSQPPLLPSRCVTALDRVAGPLENDPKADSGRVEQSDPNASPSNHTIENIVFGSAIEAATQEMLNLAQPLNSHQTKY